MLTNPTIGALVFYVKDLKRTEKFYAEVLGLEVKSQTGHDGSFLIGSAGKTLLIFFEREGKPGQTPIVVFSLEGGIDELAEELVRKGVEIVLPVSETPDGGLSCDFLDPDRHVLSYYQPPGAPRHGKDR